MMRRAQPWLGTLVEISVADALPELALHAAIAAAYAEVALVHRLMSFHAADSDVARLNRAAPHEPVLVHAHTAAVLRLAQQVAAASDGIFDIGCAARLVEWECLPAPAAVAEAPTPYAPDVSVAVRRPVSGWIDLGGIAKGYAVDLAIDALHRAGVRCACVNAGGDLRVMGPDDWPVAVREPRAPSRTGSVLRLHDEAMATSASYFSARQHQGRTVCALIDGRSGQPVQTRSSISVRAPRCVLADALTKIVAASGDEHHPALAGFGATAFIL